MGDLPSYEGFAEDGENALVTELSERALADTILRVIREPELRARLVAGGLATVRDIPPPNKQAEMICQTLQQRPGRVVPFGERLMAACDVVALVFGKAAGKLAGAGR